jgi:hypothetical protein
VPRYDVVAQEAANRNIIINTIRCGSEIPGTAEAWPADRVDRRWRFSTIEADGGVQQAVTPVDAKMAERRPHRLNAVIPAATAGDFSARWWPRRRRPRRRSRIAPATTAAHGLWRGARRRRRGERGRDRP